MNDRLSSGRAKVAGNVYVVCAVVAIVGNPADLHNRPTSELNQPTPQLNVTCYQRVIFVSGLLSCERVAKLYCSCHCSYGSS